MGDLDTMILQRRHIAFWYMMNTNGVLLTPVHHLFPEQLPAACPYAIILPES